IRQLADAGIERALASAHASEIEAHRGAAQPVVHMEEVVDERIVHRAAELWVRMQDEGHRRIGRLLTLVADFDSAGRAGKNNVRHRLSAPLRPPKRPKPTDSVGFGQSFRWQNPHSYQGIRRYAGAATLNS